MNTEVHSAVATARRAQPLKAAWVFGEVPAEVESILEVSRWAARRGAQPSSSSH